MCKLWAYERQQPRDTGRADPPASDYLLRDRPGRPAGSRPREGRLRRALPPTYALLRISRRQFARPAHRALLARFSLHSVLRVLRRLLNQRGHLFRMGLVDRMTRPGDLDRLAVGALGIHPLKIWIDNPVGFGDHVPTWLGLPSGNASRCPKHGC